MKQLTDEEIIKALDGADLFLRDRVNCEPAPLNDYDKDILLDIAKTCDNAVAIINRQKAEIEKLKEENNNYQELLTHEKGGNIALRVMYDKVSKNIKTAKTEAYKEFAEKLKARTTVTAHGFGDDRYDLINDDFIEKILKEMVGKKQ